MRIHLSQVPLALRCGSPCWHISASLSCWTLSDRFGFGVELWEGVPSVKGQVLLHSFEVRSA